MPHWLVVGGAGFIGKHLVQRILKGFDSVSVVDVAHPPISWTQTDQIDYHRMGGEDITRDMIATADYIVYLAGQTDVGVSKRSPLLNFSQNVVNLFRFMEVVRNHVPSGLERIIYMSSKNVYGKRLPRSMTPLCFETDVLTPIEPYGLSKCMADIMCQGYASCYSLPITVLRNTTTYGPSGRPDLVISLFIKRALSSMPLVIYGDGKNRYDFNYVDNLLDAIILAVEKPQGIYNIASGERYELKETASLIVELANSRSEIKFDESKSAESVEQLMSIEKAWNGLGYHPKVKLRDGLQRTVGWYRNNQN